ncbi:MAG: tetratricopeptide repeat protein [Bacteroidota bacterium]
MNKLKVFFLLVFICKISFANNKIDSLKTVIKNSKEDSAKVKTQNILTWEYIYLSDFANAKAVAEQAVILAQKINNNEGEARALNNIGVTHYYKSEFPQTLDFYFKSLKVYEKIKDSKGVMRVKKNIALVYMDQNEYEKAEKIIVESIKYCEQIKDTNSLAGSLTLQALIKSKNKKTVDEAITIYNKALQLYKQTGNQYDYAACLDNLGNVYYNSGNFKKALELYNQSYPLYIKGNYLPDAVNSISNIGSVYMLLGDFSKAEKIIIRGLVMADSLQLINLASQNHLNLSEMYVRWNKPAKSLEHYKKYIILRDSIYNEENTKKLVRSEMNFDFDKKEALQKVEQEKKDLLAKEEKQKQQIVIASVSAVLLLVLIFSVLLFKRFKITQKQKAIIEKQKHETELQKELVEEKNKEIVDSITYAKRLQDAILPPLKLVQKYLEHSFILYKPKDIVAGDFYWFENKGDLLLFAAADCTGHGVPGAMVSVVCSNALNRTVKEFGITEPGKILDKVRELVVETFEKSESEVKDGMDISLCALNTKTNELFWSGANNPLWLIRASNSEQSDESKTLDTSSNISNLNTHILIEYKADKQPIGKTENSKLFSTQKIDLQKNDTFYIFTDGYCDQFGGDGGKKFKSANFKKFLLTIQDSEMSTQSKLINDVFEEWRGHLEQVDDVCVIGVRV